MVTAWSCSAEPSCGLVSVTVIETRVGLSGLEIEAADEAMAMGEPLAENVVEKLVVAVLPEEPARLTLGAVSRLCISSSPVSEAVEVRNNRRETICGTTPCTAKL